MRRNAPIPYKGRWIAVVVTPEGSGSRGQYWVAQGAGGEGPIKGRTLLPSVAVTEEDAWDAAEQEAKRFIDSLG